MNQLYILNIIRKCFTVDLPFCPFVSDMVNSTQGREPISEAIHFFQLPWHEINSDILREHYSAFYFFNDKFYKYYLPAVATIACAEFEKVSDAALLIICDMSDSTSSRFAAVYDKLDIDQLTAMNNWLDVIKENAHNYLSENEWNSAKRNLSVLARAGEF